GYALLLIIFLRDPPAEDRGPSEQTVPPVQIGHALRALFTVPTFRFLLLVNTLVGVANWTIYGWLPTFLRERFELSQGQAGLTATATLQIASFVGILGGGALSDFLSRRNPRARMLVPAWGYLAAAPALLFLASSQVLLMALAGLVVYGVARGFFDANLMPMARQSVNE